MRTGETAKRVFGAALLAAWSTQAQQVGWPPCTGVSESDFTVEKIVTRAKDDAHSPLKIDFHQVEEGGKVYTNFYFTEIHSGKVRYYNDATNAVSDVGTVVGGKFGDKDTFSGLALDPDFKTNRWIYLHYSGSGVYRLARYTITPDNKLDPASMKVLMDIPKKDTQWHGESAIDFDAYGDLWFGIGDNGTHNDATGNYGLSTADYRASILRIHPKADGTYSIPSKATGDPTGNMGEYWSAKFAEMGETALAAEYKDPKKVLPEIYVTGVRNPYTLKVVHAAKRWVAFGDVGPDKGQVSEEFNILQQPGFAGWPVWAGQVAHFKPSGATLNFEGISRISTASSRGGASGLPPVIRSQFDVKQSSGMSGPIYWYDGRLKSDRKFPAYYHGKWFVADNDESGWSGPPWVKVVTLNADYTKSVSDEPFFAFTKERIQEIYFGPDGAMYIAYFYKPWFGDSAPNEIVRISYKGTNRSCLPTELVPPDGAVPTPVADRKSSTPGIQFTAWGGFRLPGGNGAARLFDVLGNEVPLRHEGNGFYRTQSKPIAGVYFLKAGAQTWKVSNLGGK